MKSVKEVKKLVADYMNNRKKGVSVALWGDDKDDIDRIIIKFPRSLIDFISLTTLTEEILSKNGFHVAQIMGFMEIDKLWILLIRDRRKPNA